MSTHQEPIDRRSDFDFTERRVLVTGATRGIGLGIAEAFASRGARVAVCARDAQAVQTVAEDLSSRYRTDCFGLPVDVTSPEAVDATFDEISRRWKGLDVLVNNAGIANSIAIKDLDEAAWRSVLDTNLGGVYRSCRSALRYMERGAAIVNIASISGSMVNVPQFQANYNASKAAVIMFTRSLAVEVAPRGIRVNCVSPGYTLTDMNRRPEVQDLIAIWTERTPLKRLARIDEVVAPVLFLASDMAGFITGHDLVADGGITVLC